MKISQRGKFKLAVYGSVLAGSADALALAICHCWRARSSLTVAHAAATEKAPL